MWCSEKWFYCQVINCCQQYVSDFIDWCVEVVNIVVNFCQCYYC